MAYTIVETSGPITDDILGDDIHEKYSETNLILVISQMEILLEAGNTGVSCSSVTLALYTCINQNIFFTNIGTILKDDYKQTETVFLVKEERDIPKTRRDSTRP